MNYEYIFIIYSCKKYRQKAELLYHLTNTRLDKTKCYIVNGDPTKQKYEIVDDKYLMLPCEDTYEHLTNKTLCLLKTVACIHPTCKGMIKCDDDIYPNVKSINDFIVYLNYHPNKAYIGTTLTHPKGMSQTHYNKVSDRKYNVPMRVPECTYASGPFYYLNMNAIKSLNTNTIDKFFYEDIMIGYNLNKMGILPEYYFLYTDHFDVNTLSNYQNTGNIKKLYITLQGSLQDQVRQISSGYTIAKRKSMYLIFVYNQGLEQPLLCMLENFQYIHMNYVKCGIVCTSLDDIERASDKTDILVNMLLNDFQEYKEEVVDLLENPSISYEEILSLFH